MISLPWKDRADPSLLAGQLALSAGTVIRVGAMHLLQMVERETARFAPLALARGVLVVPLIIISAGAD